jgi:ABC-2 type transport system permease protein
LPRALWLLLGLQTRAWLRSAGRSLRTVKGALLALLGLLVFLPWMLSLVLAPATTAGMSAEVVRTWGPGWLLLYCVVNVLLSSGERALYFNPAEVQFLFPAPFSRRQILAYKLYSTLILAWPSALILSMVLRIHAHSWIATLVATLLGLGFLQLFGTALNLLAVGMGKRFYTWGQRAVLVMVVLLGALLLAPLGHTLLADPTGSARQAVQSTVWRVATAPLRPLVETFLAERVWPDLLGWAMLALAIDAALLGIVFALDANYLEATAASSARLYARLQRLRGVAVRDTGKEPGEALSGPPRKRWSLPMPPGLGGIGPMFWRQLVTAFRQPTNVVVLTLLFVFLRIGLIFIRQEQSASANDLVILTAIFMVFMTPFLTTLLPFDFRADLDRMALLKTLPLPAWRLSVGQLLAPVLLMTLLHWLALASVAIVFLFEPAGNDFSRSLLILAGLAALVVPFNFLLFAVDNLLFLLFPTRLISSSPGDLQAVGRNLLLYLIRVVVLLVVFTVASTLGMVTWMLSDGNIAAAVVTGWLVLCIAAISIVPVVALAFDGFDVPSDTPG